MKKPLATILAALVFIANTICVCMGSTGATSAEHGAPSVVASHCHPKPRHEGCKGHPEKGQPSKDDHGSHTCSHCTGTISAPAPQAKVEVPSPALAPLIRAVVLVELLTPQTLREVPKELLSLPPPIDPPTLLNLGCSLTT